MECKYYVLCESIFLLAKIKRIPLNCICKKTKKEESVSEITMDLRLVFTIPETGLKINGLIQGMKEAAPRFIPRL